MTAPLSAPSVRRRLAVVAVCSAAAALTAGCTAHMDMTISPTDTYDVVMEMRDTTGTVFTADTDCSAYADPALVGEFRGAQVSARAIGSVDDDDGVGCEVRVTGVAVPGATQAPQGAGLVVHDGDLYVVDLTALATGLTGGGAPGAAGGEDGVGGGDGASAGGADPAGDGASGASAGGAGAAGSLNGVVDARVTVSFPGAVVDAGGGRVSGSSVTWTDPDVLAAGVRATGYATSNAGLSVWDRFSTWIIGGVVAVGIGVGVVAWRRRCAPSDSKDRSGPKDSSRSKSPSDSKGKRKGKGRRNR